MKKEWISQLKVLKSNAGYYIGRMCQDEDGCMQPYSRESGYYRTREEAEHDLCEEHGDIKKRMQEGEEF